MLRKNSYLWFFIIMLFIGTAYNTYIGTTNNYLVLSQGKTYDMHIASGARSVQVFKDQMIHIDNQLDLLIELQKNQVDLIQKELELRNKNAVMLQKTLELLKKLKLEHVEDTHNVLEDIKDENLK